MPITMVLGTQAVIRTEFVTREKSQLMLLTDSFLKK